MLQIEWAITHQRTPCSRGAARHGAAGSRQRGRLAGPGYEPEKKASFDRYRSLPCGWSGLAAQAEYMPCLLRLQHRVLYMLIRLCGSTGTSILRLGTVIGELYVEHCCEVSPRWEFMQAVS